MKSRQWSRRRCNLKFFSFKSGGHFVHDKGTISAIVVEGHRRNISVKLF